MRWAMLQLEAEKRGSAMRKKERKQAMEREEKLKRIMERAVEEREVAGVSLLVKKEGREICSCEAGWADAEAGKPMRRDTILRLYSQTKPVTAAAAMVTRSPPRAYSSWSCRRTISTGLPRLES